MSEINYSTTELSTLKYVKIIYKGLDNKLHEICTEVKTLGYSTITLFFRYNKDFNINYPQKIKIKFVTENAMYLADATLLEIKKADMLVYFTILPPTKMEKQQKRRYCRINLIRPCVLVCANKEGQNDTYISNSINLSACGILIHKLETMNRGGYVSIKPDEYEKFRMLLVLETDMVLKLSSRYVRMEEYSDEPDRYAFEFIDADDKNTDKISKFVAKEQIEQLKQKKVKQ